MPDPTLLTSFPNDPLSASGLKDWESAWNKAHAMLRQERTAAGHWVGELSTSALSTATAVSALAQLRRTHAVQSTHRQAVDTAIDQGCVWLQGQQNEDGGFGDTDRSHSNIATTLLVLAAWELAKPSADGSLGSVGSPSGPAAAAPPTAPVTQAQAQVQFDSPTMQAATQAAWGYVERQGKWKGLRQRYGKDKTFVVPILSNCALAGLVPWSDVPPLPFEAAWLPQELYRWARMPVVSYAIPALVAIGQARFHFAPPRNPLLRVLRRRGRGPTLRVLRNMQPASGGYLEATPLTSFVLMSLAAVGNGHLPVARDCLRFLLDSRLPDGSWPIDTNLATWLTSLSIQAVARRWGTCTLPSVAGGQTPDATGDATEDGVEAAAARLSAENSAVGSPAAATVASPTSPVAEPLVTAQTVRWLLSCQHRRRHPFTGANPGGWGWTDLSGAVPDADDTPAALLALHAIDWRPAELQRLEQQALDAVCQGLAWLLRLQNRDGGWPTFCRGWGTLPFDRSGTDLTAHVLRAFAAWLPQLDRVRAAAGRTVPQASQLQAASRRGLAYLGRTQQPDGSWLPLWFGNQDRPAEDNPAYGTGKVLLAYGALGLQNCRPAQRGMDYLRENQNKDGGWGGGPSVRYPGLLGKPPLASGDFSSTIEETAVAVEGLCSCSVQPRADATIMQALDWLAQAVHSGNLRCSWPIGFYFAKLWYHERLYPAIFSLSAFGAALHPVRPNISR